MKKTITVITGPTASGKSAIAMLLAEKLSGQIVCMDSMQIYRRMDIGTAKPTLQDRIKIPHYMLDIADPCEDYSAARYREECYPLLSTLSCPILTGGTGLYLNAVSRNMDFGQAKSDEKVRQKYQDLLEKIGREELHNMLRGIDPEAAEKLHVNDTRRVIRALEVYEITGVPFSRQKPMDDLSSLPFDFRIYAPLVERSLLYLMIDRRVDQMMRSGLMDEVEQLYKSGVPASAQAIQGIGYKELYAVLSGEASLSSAVDLIKQRTRNYAKRQMTWFRRDDRVVFLDTAGQSSEQMADRILNDILNESSKEKEK